MEKENFDINSLDGMKRPELQKVAKLFGVRANMKNTEIIDQVRQIVLASKTAMEVDQKVEEVVEPQAAAAVIAIAEPLMEEPVDMEIVAPAHVATPIASPSPVVATAPSRKSLYPTLSPAKEFTYVPSFVAPAAPKPLPCTDLPTEPVPVAAVPIAVPVAAVVAVPSAEVSVEPVVVDDPKTKQSFVTPRAIRKKQNKKTRTSTPSTPAFVATTTPMDVAASVPTSSSSSSSSSTEEAEASSNLKAEPSLQLAMEPVVQSLRRSSRLSADRQSIEKTRQDMKTSATTVTDMDIASVQNATVDSAAIKEALLNEIEKRVQQNAKTATAEEETDAAPRDFKEERKQKRAQEIKKSNKARSDSVMNKIAKSKLSKPNTTTAEGKKMFEKIHAKQFDKMKSIADVYKPKSVSMETETTSQVSKPVPSTPLSTKKKTTQTPKSAKTEQRKPLATVEKVKAKTCDDNNSATASTIAPARKTVTTVAAIPTVTPTPSKTAKGQNQMFAKLGNTPRPVNGKTLPSVANAEEKKPLNTKLNSVAPKEKEPSNTVTVKAKQPVPLFNAAPKQEAAAVPASKPVGYTPKKGPVPKFGSENKPSIANTVAVAKTKAVAVEGHRDTIKKVHMAKTKAQTVKTYLNGAKQRSADKRSEMRALANTVIAATVAANGGNRQDN